MNTGPSWANACSRTGSTSSTRSARRPRAPMASASFTQSGPDVEIAAADPVVVDELLPLAHHAQVAVVDDRHLHRQALLHRRHQLLDGHQQRAVAGDAHHGLAGPGHLGADGRGQAEAHGPEAAGRDPVVRRLAVVVLRGPHLVLAHVGGDHRPPWVIW